MKHQEVNSQTIETDQNTVIREPQTIKTSNTNTQEKIDKTLKQIEEVKTLITKNTQKLDQKINEIDRTVQSPEKIEESKEKSSWSSILKKQEHATLIAAKNPSGFNINRETKNEISESNSIEIFEKIRNIAQKSNTKIRYMDVLKNRKGINIQGFSNDKETIKQAYIIYIGII